MTEPTNNNNPEENGALNAENGATPVEDTHSTPERKRLTWKPVAAWSPWPRRRPWELTSGCSPP